MDEDGASGSVSEERMSLADFVVALQQEDGVALADGVKQCRDAIARDDYSVKNGQQDTSSEDQPELHSATSQSNRPLVEQYLDSSPEAAEIFTVWDNIGKDGGGRLVTVIVDLVGVLLHFAPADQATPLAWKVIRTKAKSISNALSSKAPRLIRCTFKLLTTIIGLSASLAREVARRVAVPAASIERLASTRHDSGLQDTVDGNSKKGGKHCHGSSVALSKRAAKAIKSAAGSHDSESLAKHAYLHGRPGDDVRAAFVAYTCALLSCAASDVARETMRSKQMVHAMLKGLSEDAAPVALACISALGSCLLLPGGQGGGTMPQRAVLDVFTPQALAHLSSLYSVSASHLPVQEDAEEEEEGVLTWRDLRHALHALLVGLTTGMVPSLAAIARADARASLASGLDSSIRVLLRAPTSSMRGAGGTGTGGSTSGQKRRRAEGVDSEDATHNVSSSSSKEDSGEVEEEEEMVTSVCLCMPAAALASLRRRHRRAHATPMAGTGHGQGQGQGEGTAAGGEEGEESSAGDLFSAEAGAEGAALAAADPAGLGEQEEGGEGSLLSTTDADLEAEAGAAAMVDARRRPGRSGKGGTPAAGGSGSAGSSLASAAAALGYPPLALALILSLDRPAEDPLQGDLLHRLLASFPRLTLPLTRTFPLALEPRPSLKWAASVALYRSLLDAGQAHGQGGQGGVLTPLGLFPARTVQLRAQASGAALLLVGATGDGPGAVGGIPLGTWARLLVPAPVGRALLVRGLRHAHPAVLLHSLLLLRAVVVRIGAAIREACTLRATTSIAGAGAEEEGQGGVDARGVVDMQAALQACAAHRASILSSALSPMLPDIQSLIALRARAMALINASAAADGVLPTYDLSLATGTGSSSGGAGGAADGGGSLSITGLASTVSLPASATAAGPASAWSGVSAPDTGRLLYAALCSTFHALADTLPGYLQAGVGMGMGAGGEGGGEHTYAGGYDCLKLLPTGGAVGVSALHGDGAASPPAAASALPSLLSLLQALPAPTSAADALARWLPKPPQAQGGREGKESASLDPAGHLLQCLDSPAATLVHMCALPQLQVSSAAASTASAIFPPLSTAPAASAAADAARREGSAWLHAVSSLSSRGVGEEQQGGVRQACALALLCTYAWRERDSAGSTAALSSPYTRHVLQCLLTALESACEETMLALPSTAHPPAPSLVPPGSAGKAGKGGKAGHKGAQHAAAAAQPSTAAVESALSSQLQTLRACICACQGDSSLPAPGTGSEGVDAGDGAGGGGGRSVGTTGTTARSLAITQTTQALHALLLQPAGLAYILDGLCSALLLPEEEVQGQGLPVHRALTCTLEALRTLQQASALLPSSKASASAHPLVRHAQAPAAGHAHALWKCITWRVRPVPSLVQGDTGALAPAQEDSDAAAVTLKTLGGSDGDIIRDALALPPPAFLSALPLLVLHAALVQPTVAGNSAALGLALVRQAYTGLLSAPSSVFAWLLGVGEGRSREDVVRALLPLAPALPTGSPGHQLLQAAAGGSKSACKRVERLLGEWLVSCVPAPVLLLHALPLLASSTDMCTGKAGGKLRKALVSAFFSQACAAHHRAQSPAVHAEQEAAGAASVSLHLLPGLGAGTLLLQCCALLGRQLAALLAGAMRPAAGVKIGCAVGLLRLACVLLETATPAGHVLRGGGGGAAGMAISEAAAGRAGRDAHRGVRAAAGRALLPWTPSHLVTLVSASPALAEGVAQALRTVASPALAAPLLHWCVDTLQTGSSSGRQKRKAGKGAAKGGEEAPVGHSTAQALHILQALMLTHNNSGSDFAALSSSHLPALLSAPTRMRLLALLLTHEGGEGGEGEGGGLQLRLLAALVASPSASSHHQLGQGAAASPLSAALFKQLLALALRASRPTDSEQQEDGEEAEAEQSARVQLLHALTAGVSRGNASGAVQELLQACVAALCPPSPSPSPSHGGPWHSGRVGVALVGLTLTLTRQGVAQGSLQPSHLHSLYDTLLTRCCGSVSQQQPELLPLLCALGDMAGSSTPAPGPAPAPAPATPPAPVPLPPIEALLPVFTSTVSSAEVQAAAGHFLRARLGLGLGSGGPAQDSKEGLAARAADLKQLRAAVKEQESCWRLVSLAVEASLGCLRPTAASAAAASAGGGGGGEGRETGKVRGKVHKAASKLLSLCATLTLQAVLGLKDKMEAGEEEEDVSGGAALPLALSLLSSAPAPWWEQVLPAQAGEGAEEEGEGGEGSGLTALLVHTMHSCLTAPATLKKSGRAEGEEEDGGEEADGHTSTRRPPSLLSLPGVVTVVDLCLLRLLQTGGGVRGGLAPLPTLLAALVSHPSFLHLLLRNKYSSATPSSSPASPSSSATGVEGARQATARLLLRLALADGSTGTLPAPLLPLLAAAYTGSLGAADRYLRLLLELYAQRWGRDSLCSPAGLAYAWSSQALGMVRWDSAMLHARVSLPLSPAPHRSEEGSSKQVQAGGGGEPPFDPSTSPSGTDWLWLGETPATAGTLSLSSAAAASVGRGGAPFARGGGRGGAFRRPPRARPVLSFSAAASVAPPAFAGAALAGAHTGLLVQRVSATLSTFPVYRGLGPEATTPHASGEREEEGEGEQCGPSPLALHILPRVVGSGYSDQALEAEEEEEQEERERARAGVYDPSWLLPAMLTAAASESGFGRAVPARRFVSSGGLAYTLACTTSAHAGVRQAAYAVLGQYWNAISPGAGLAGTSGPTAHGQGQGEGGVSTTASAAAPAAPASGYYNRPPPALFKEQPQIGLLLLAVRASVRSPLARLTAGQAGWVAEAAQILLKPTHPAYAMLNKAMGKLHRFDPLDVPLLYACILGPAGGSGVLAAAATRGMAGGQALLQAGLLGTAGGIGKTEDLLAALAGAASGSSASSLPAPVAFILRMCMRSLQGAEDHAALRKRHGYHLLLALAEGCTAAQAGGSASSLLPHQASTASAILRAVCTVLLRAARLRVAVVVVEADEEGEGAADRPKRKGKKAMKVAVAQQDAMEEDSDDEDDDSASTASYSASSSSSGSGSSSSTRASSVRDSDEEDVAAAAAAGDEILDVDAPADSGGLVAEPEAGGAHAAGSPPTGGQVVDLVSAVTGGAGSHALVDGRPAAGGLQATHPGPAIYLRRSVAVLPWVTGLWSRASTALTASARERGLVILTPAPPSPWATAAVGYAGVGGLGGAAPPAVCLAPGLPLDALLQAACTGLELHAAVRPKERLHALMSASTDASAAAAAAAAGAGGGASGWTAHREGEALAGELAESLAFILPLWSCCGTLARCTPPSSSRGEGAALPALQCNAPRAAKAVLSAAMASVGKRVLAELAALDSVCVRPTGTGAGGEGGGATSEAAEPVRAVLARHRQAIAPYVQAVKHAGFV